MTSAETWLPVVGFEGLYLVSNLGRVISCAMSVRGARDYSRGAIVMRQRLDGGGEYPIVGLVKDSVRTTHSVHRLVASAFCPNSKHLEQVNHIDGNKKNNNASNLEWVTRSQNAIHAHTVLGRRGSAAGKFGSASPKHRVIEQRTSAGELIAVWHGALEASRTTGIDASSIHKACKGARTGPSGFVWRYA
jgi:hypothetical protein